MGKEAASLYLSVKVDAATARKELKNIYGIASNEAKKAATDNEASARRSASAVEKEARSVRASKRSIMAEINREAAMLERATRQAEREYDRQAKAAQRSMEAQTRAYKKAQSEQKRGSAFSQAVMSSRFALPGTNGNVMPLVGQTLKGGAGGLAGIAAVGAAGAAAQGFARGIGQAGSLEKNLNVIQQQSKATDAQMKQLSQTARDLGADISLPATSSVDASASMLALSRAGNSVKDSMDGARGSLQLAAAAEADVTTASKIVGDTMVKFGLAGTQATHVADLLSATVNETNAELIDLAYSLNYAAPSAAQLKIPIEDVVTSLALLARAGIKGEQAGTGMRAIFDTLVKPTKEAKKVLDALGISVFDQSGKFIGMKKVVDLFTRSLGPLTDEQKGYTLATIFGREAQAAANIVLGAGVEKYSAMGRTVNSAGSAASTAAAKTKGYQGAVDALSSTTDTFLEKHASGFLKFFTDVIKDGGRAVTLLDQYIDRVNKIGNAKGPRKEGEGFIGYGMIDSAKAILDTLELNNKTAGFNESPAGKAAQARQDLSVLREARRTGGSDGLREVLGRRNPAGLQTEGAFGILRKPAIEAAEKQAQAEVDAYLKSVKTGLKKAANGEGVHGSGVVVSGGRTFGNLNDDFAGRLNQMIAASGGRIKVSDGFRSLAEQKDVKRRKPGLAATPGKSNHGFGTAADLSGDLELAHKLAAEFGLSFPMNTKIPGKKYEPWHVELAKGKRAPVEGGSAAIASIMNEAATRDAEKAQREKDKAAREADRKREEAEARARRTEQDRLRAISTDQQGILGSKQSRFGQSLDLLGEAQDPDQIRRLRDALLQMSEGIKKQERTVALSQKNMAIFQDPANTNAAGADFRGVIGDPKKGILGTAAENAQENQKRVLDKVQEAYERLKTAAEKRASQAEKDAEEEEKRRKEAARVYGEYLDIELRRLTGNYDNAATRTEATQAASGISDNAFRRSALDLTEALREAGTNWDKSINAFLAFAADGGEADRFSKRVAEDISDKFAVDLSRYNENSVGTEGGNVITLNADGSYTTEKGGETSSIDPRGSEKVALNTLSEGARDAGQNFINAIIDGRAKDALSNMIDDARRTVAGSIVDYATDRIINRPLDAALEKAMGGMDKIAAGMKGSALQIAATGYGLLAALGQQGKKKQMGSILGGLAGLAVGSLLPGVSLLAGAGYGSAIGAMLTPRAGGGPMLPGRSYLFEGNRPEIISMGKNGVGFASNNVREMGGSGRGVTLNYVHEGDINDRADREGVMSDLSIALEDFTNRGAV